MMGGEEKEPLLTPGLRLGAPCWHTARPPAMSCFLLQDSFSSIYASRESSALPILATSMLHFCEAQLLNESVALLDLAN